MGVMSSTRYFLVSYTTTQFDGSANIASQVLTTSGEYIYQYKFSNWVKENNPKINQVFILSVTEMSLADYTQFLSEPVGKPSHLKAL